MHTVRVSNGKYTFRVVSEETLIVIDRYDAKRWHEQSDAFNALHSVVAELDAARVVLDAARELVKRGEAPMALRDALTKHAALVDDREGPSEWAVPR